MVLIQQWTIKFDVITSNWVMYYPLAGAMMIIRNIGNYGVITIESCMDSREMIIILISIGLNQN